MIMERIKIHGIGSEMQGVGRIADGRTAFVPGALPGETVDVEITRDANRFCEARLVRIIETSEHRRTPECPHFGLCGGCSARHMNYEYSLQMKRQRVYDALKRIGGVDDPLVYETMGSEASERCRNKAEYAVYAKDDKVLIGSYAAGSRRIVDLDDCMLQKEESIAALKWLKKNLLRFPCAGRIRYIVTRVNRRGELTLTICADAPVQTDIKNASKAIFAGIPALKSLYFCKLNMRPAHALDGVCSHVAGDLLQEDELLGLKFELSPQSFFQVNPPQAEKLYEKAIEAAEIDRHPEYRILDAYCGAGTITLTAARHAKYAVGVEIVPPAIENAKKNAARNGLSGKTRFICADAAREIPKLMAKGERFDAVIVDPPRKGCDQALLEALANAKIPVISYVSCNPSTLARDVKILSERGYKLKWAQPVDMFPWTEHVECVASIVRS